MAGMFQLFGREPQDLIDDDHDHSNDGDDHNDFDENQIKALTMYDLVFEMLTMMMLW